MFAWKRLLVATPGKKREVDLKGERKPLWKISLVGS